MCLTNSGKCHEYHSLPSATRTSKWKETYLTLIANVLISLSSWSRRAMVWMIMLSLLLTLNLTFALEYEWPNPSCAFSKSPGCKFFNNLVSWRWIPRSRSWVMSLVSKSYFFPNISLIDPASLGSDTPSVTFPPFGRFSSRNALRWSCTWPDN